MPFAPENLSTPGNLSSGAVPVVPVQSTNAIPELQAITQKPLDQASADVLEEKQKTDAAATTDAMAGLIQTKNDMTYGPNGVVTKKGKDAQQLTQTMMPAWGEAVKTITDKLTPQQLEKIRPAIKDQSAEFNTLVATHEKEERQNYFQTTSDNVIKNLQADTISNYPVDPGKVKENIDAQLSEVKKQAVWNGWDDATTEAHAHAVINATHDGVIQQLLTSKQYPQAQAYFDQYGGEITGDVKKDIMKGLREGAVSQETLNLMKQFGSTYALPGGKVNEVKLQNDVNALPDSSVKGGFSPDEKISMNEKLKGLAYERSAGNVSLKDAAQTSFMNSLVDFKAKGGPPDANGQPTAGTLENFQAKIAANPWGVDDATLAKFNTIATKMYKPGIENKDDPQVASSLVTQILNGTGDPQAAVDLAAKQNKISAQTQIKLDKQIAENILNGPPGAARQAWKTISNLADHTYGKDSADAHDFKYYIYTHAQGKIDTDVVDFAQKEVAKVPKTEFGVWSKVADYNKTKGQPDPGHPWLGQSAQNKAVAEAVKSLRAANKPVTPEMIDWVLKKAPDGKF